MTVINNREIARDITLKMIELGHIQLDRYAYENESDITKSNNFNAKQVSDFFNQVYKIIAE